MRKLIALIGCGWWLSAQAGDAAPVAFDHAWIVASPGAPERKLLADVGFSIAAQTNHHEGQGTSSITVEFENGYLELVWVDDTVPGAPPVVEKFRNRAQWRTTGWSPIGIGLHRTAPGAQPLPWPSWQIPRAAWLPEGEFIEMLTPREQPKAPSVFVTPPSLAIVEPRQQTDDLDHRNRTKRITGVRMIVPSAQEIAGLPAAALAKMGVAAFSVGDCWTLEVTLDGHVQEKERDFRPQLPLVLRY
jgi:hypothetical protein